jgi:hypothetical protein
VRTDDLSPLAKAELIAAIAQKHGVRAAEQAAAGDLTSYVPCGLCQEPTAMPQEGRAVWISGVERDGRSVWKCGEIWCGACAPLVHDVYAFLKKPLTKGVG